MGRPRIIIDESILAELARHHCTVEEMASIMGLSKDTLERRYAAVIKKGKDEGKRSLRRMQYQAAEKGSIPMMIWLGKQLLHQRDRFPDEYPESMQLPKKEEKQKTFSEFCKTAGYPKPYDKQIEMKDFVFNSEGAVLLLGARGYGKTDYVSILGTAFEIYKNPRYSCLIVTKSDDRSSSIVGEILTACTLNGMTFEKENSREIRVKGLHGKDPSVAGLTIGSKGFRGRHPDRIIMDDPVTPDDESEATRRKAERLYDECLKLCENIAVIGQPVHKYDLFEKLRPIIQKMELPFGSIPQLDVDLEAQRLAGVSEESIQKSYFLKCISEGTSPFDQVKYMDDFPPGDTAVAFIDPSHKGGDYTALSIFKSYFDGVAVKGHVYKKAWNHCIEEMCAHMKACNVKKICFETNSLGDQPVISLRQALEGSGIGIIGRDSTTNKHSRIMAAGVYAPLIHLAKTSDRLYIDHVVKYEYGSQYDDAPDSLATGLCWIGLIRGKE